MGAVSDEAKANKREYNKRWAKENRGRMKELQKQFLDRNPDYMKNAQRKYYEANRERINKRAIERRLENLEETKEKERAYYHKRKATDPDHTEKARDYRIRGRYGITQAEADQMLTTQGNCCAACGTTEPGSKYSRWHIDHCHASGKIRSLLCHHCNVIVGMSGEDADKLHKIADYIQTHKGTKI